MLKSGVEWYKNNPADKIWWKDDNTLSMIFSFDRVHEFNLYGDYPDKLTPEEKEIFDRENPFWKEYFTGDSWPWPED